MPARLVSTLAESQARTARHKCAICAFGNGTQFEEEPGRLERCRHGNIAPVRVLAGLPEYQGGPGRHKCSTCAFAVGALDGSVKRMPGTGAEDDEGAVEGSTVVRLHRTYERNRQNRSRAIEYHGTTCVGCGFNFDDAYTSEHARGYIEIHHLQPFATGPRLVRPHRDLIPLCANCHRMVHRRPNRWLDLDQLRALLAKGSRED